MSRRQVIQASATSGALAIWPATFIGGRASSHPKPATPAALHPHSISGTTLESTLRRPSGPGYRRLHEGPGDKAVVRDDLGTAHKGRENRRVGRATLVQVSDLHVTDVQNPMRFEYLDRYTGVGHRPHEFLGLHGTTALVGRINGLEGGPWTGRAVDAVVSTGDNTDNQSHNELAWLLGVLAGGTVRADSGSLEGFEGVATSGFREYWQPETGVRDTYKHRGFPQVHGLIEAATRPFTSPGLSFPWLLTMGNHDTVAGGMLGNRGYVEEWATGHRKIFSSHTEATVQLANILKQPAAGSNVGNLMSVIAKGHTRTVHSDELRRPFTGADYLKALRDPKYAGAGPVGHGYDTDADADRLYFSYHASDLVTVISLDTTNQAGGALGSIGSQQLAWLDTTLASLIDRYVVVLSHHPSNAMGNLAPDPRRPHEQRHNGNAVIRVVQKHPQVVGWVNGHTHHNAITPHRPPTSAARSGRSIPPRTSIHRSRPACSRSRATGTARSRCSPR
jgi:metallophosphoesterase (TIGR03767 family)